MTSRVRIAVCDAGPLLVDRSDLMVGDSGPVGSGSCESVTGQQDSHVTMRWTLSWSDSVTDAPT